MGDLDVLADDLLGREPGGDLSIEGPYSTTFCDLVSDSEGFSYPLDKSWTSPLIATIFWRTFIASPAYRRELSRAGATSTSVVSGEPVIVRHGMGWRHDANGMI